MSIRRLRRVVERHKDWVVAGVLVALSMAWSIIAFIRAPELSRLDEWTYIDYAWKVSGGHIPIQGEDLGLEARSAWSCRAMEGSIHGVAPPACNEVGQLPAQMWPFKGENYNAFHPPFFFFLAGIFGRIVSLLPGVGFVTGARLFCAIVVAAGGAGLYLAIRHWKIGSVAAFAGTLVVLSTPGIAASGAMMHSEAANLLAGAAAVWIGARILVHHNLKVAAPVAVALAIASIRVISVVGLLSVLAFVAFCAVFPRLGGFKRSDSRALAIIVISSLVAIFAAYFAWTLFQHGRTPEGYVPAITGTSTSPYEGQVKRVFGTLVAPYGLTQHPYDWYIQENLRSDSLISWANGPLYWFYIVLPFAGLALLIRDASKRMLAGSALVGPLVASVVVQGREILSNGAYFRVMSGRYALTTVPLFGATAAAIFDRKYARWVLLAFGLISYGILITSPWMGLTPS